MLSNDEYNLLTYLLIYLTKQILTLSETKKSLDKRRLNSKSTCDVPI